MNEIWKDIKGFENKYQVSNLGRVKSLARLRKTKNGYLCPVKEKILKPKVGTDGYLSYGLCIGTHQKCKYIRVNVLVYQTFVGAIPKGYDIHHKNHIRTDNRLENLCLVEKSKHLKLHHSKAVKQFTLDGQFVAEYPSATEAAKQTGICRADINKCCLNKQYHKLAGGFIWKFKEAA